MTPRSPAVWGAWGVGRFAETHIIPAFASTQRLTRVATRAENLHGRAADFNGQPLYCSASDLLGDESITHVYIGLPTGLHHEATLAALDAGKHVLVEKPYALAAHDLAPLAQHRSSGLQVGVAWMYRHHPRWERIFRLIVDGTIGEVTEVHFTYRFNDTTPSPTRRSRELGGGAFGLVGVYGLHIALKLCGATTSIHASGNTEPGQAVEHSCRVNLEFPTAVATITCTSRAPVPYQHVTIHGTVGTLLVDTPINPQPDELTSLHLLLPSGSTTETFPPSDQFALQAEWASLGMQDYDDFNLDFHLHPATSETITRALTADP